MKLARDYVKVICIFVLYIWMAPVHVFAQSPLGTKSTAPVAADEKSATQKESLFKKLGKTISGDAKKIKGIKKPAFIARDSTKYAMQVYGWHPYWMGDTHFDYNYNLLTTLSYFSCDIVYNAAKDIEYQLNGWDEPGTAQMIQQARADGCRIDLTVHCQDQQLISTILNNPDDQLNCINMIGTMLNVDQKADGVTIYFESMPEGNEVQLTKFMQALYDTLNAKGKTVTLTIPASDDNNQYQVKELSAFVHQFILMGYDNKKKSNTPGPVAPLESFSWNSQDLKRSVGKYLSAGLPKNKLILALPYYGAVWEVDSSSGKKKYRFHGQVKYNKVADHSAKHAPRIQYDSTSQSNYYTYSEGGKSFICFYDNPRSIKKKYEWAGQQGLAGVGIWALGYDDGHKDMWDALDKKVNVVKMDSTLTKPVALSDSAALNRTAGAGEGGAATGNKTAEADTTGAAKAPEITWVTEMEGVAKNPKVLTAIILTLAVFSLAGIGFSMSYEVVREKVMITEVATYALVQLLLILTFVSFYIIIGFVAGDPETEEYVSADRMKVWLVLLGVFAEVIINLLSYKMFTDHLRRGRLP